jgi:DNA-binding transcriptional MerR regulator
VITKYRYYTDDQVSKLVKILDLKDIGFSLNEIKESITAGLNYDILLDKLGKKQIEAEDRIILEKLRIANITMIQNRILLAAKSNIHKSGTKEEEKYNVKVSRLITLDSTTSYERHTIEEAIWL